MTASYGTLRVVPDLATRPVLRGRPGGNPGPAHVALPLGRATTRVVEADLDAVIREHNAAASAVPRMVALRSLRDFLA